jgi:hypothetical protein
MILYVFPSCFQGWTIILENVNIFSIHRCQFNRLMWGGVRSPHIRDSCTLDLVTTIVVIYICIQWNNCRSFRYTQLYCRVELVFELVITILAFLRYLMYIKTQKKKIKEKSKSFFGLFFVCFFCGSLPPHIDGSSDD